MKADQKNQFSNIRLALRFEHPIQKMRNLMGNSKPGKRTKRGSKLQESFGLRMINRFQEKKEDRNKKNKYRWGKKR